MLIDTLRVQHDEIETRVKNITAALASGAVPVVKQELAAFKTALLAHLDLEDRELYPALTEAAAAMPFEVPAQLTRVYQQNMESVSVAIKTFLTAHGGDDLNLVDFRRDWGMVSQLLAHRIDSEELTLYPLYRSLVNKET